MQFFNVLIFQYSLNSTKFVRSIRMFIDTGFNVKTSTVKKKAKRRKVAKRREDSDEDDVEWMPGCEEAGRKRRSMLVLNMYCC